MSTVRVDSLQASDGQSPPFGTGGIAKVWVDYNHINNIVEKSANLSSMTDNGVGLFTANFTNSMDGSGYAAMGSWGNGSSTVTGTGWRPITKAAASLYAQTTANASASDSFSDGGDTHEAIWGDLA